MHRELLGTSSIKKKRSTSVFCGMNTVQQRRKICMNKGRGVPFSVAGVVTSTSRADFLLFTGETNVLDGATLDELMAKLLSVVWWPSVGGGEEDLRRRKTVWRPDPYCGGPFCRWSS